MSAEEIRAVWDSLKAPAVEGEFAINRAMENLFFAKSSNEESCLIAVFSDGVPLPSGRQTRGLGLEFYSELELRNPNPSVQPAAVLRCRDTAFEFLFAVMVDGMLEFLRGNSGVFESPERVLEYVENWQDLFARPRRLTFEEQLGLWGELWVIYQSPNPARAIEVWHGPYGSVCDFRGSGIEIEVKTALGRHEHRFSLEQVGPSRTGAERYVYSLVVEEEPVSGLTLIDLVRRVRAAAPEVLIELERGLGAAGYNPSTTADTRFSLVSSKMVPIEDVPKVRVLDPGVSRVRFTASLEGCTAIAGSETVSLMNRLLSFTGDGQGNL